MAVLRVLKRQEKVCLRIMYPILIVKVKMINLLCRSLVKFYNCKDINYEPKQELAKITPHGVVPQNARALCFFCFQVAPRGTRVS